MKKRGLFFAIFLVFIVLAFTYSAVALSCPSACPWASECVCGQCPDSILGFGQVVVYGFTYSCNNIGDGLCPEDYQDAYNSSIYADCSSCLDPDCTGNISGNVKNYLGIPVDKSVVTSHPVRWNLSSPSMQKFTLSDSLGKFSISNVVTGKYYFSASKESYDTELIEARIFRNKNTEINFTLLNGTCHDDCTNSYGRCNAACQGITFNNGTTSCNFYSTTTQSLCNNRVLGTSVLYQGYNSTHAYFVDCCEGTPYLNYYSKLSVDSGNIKDLINLEKISRYNDVPVKIVVAYWSPVNE